MNNSKGPTVIVSYPVQVLINLWSHRLLSGELIKRELRQQYQGSFLGAAWSILVPLFMLVIYTFVFSNFKARWSVSLQIISPGEFAVVLFAGLTPFNVFSTIANRSPGLVLQSPNYVKKVVFPLEILPVVALGTALVNSLINVVLVLIGSLLVYKTISPYVFLLPLAYLPLIFLCLGTGWMLASLGVYIRDISQVIGVVVQVLFFLTPILYPETMVPENLSVLMIAHW
jgi:lipopolysaccharide transport system permease protein